MKRVALWGGVTFALIMGSAAYLGKSTWLRDFHRLKELANGRPSDLRIVFSVPAQKASFTSDSLTIFADLFQPKQPDNTPCILLLHGSSVLGRKLPLIQVLALEFQKRNYTVLALDSRGYGESDDPSGAPTVEGFDFAADVSAALDFLSANTSVDTSRMYAVGHSFGCGVVLTSLPRERRIRKAVLFGPPRRLRERFLNPEAPERQKFLDRWQRDMKLTMPLPFDVWSQVVAPLDIEYHMEALTRPGHIPLFLIDADKETVADLAFLRSIYKRTAPPVNYWTVPGTGHYLNTGLFLGRPVYRKQFVETFVDRIDDWLKQGANVDRS